MGKQINSHMLPALVENGLLSSKSYMQALSLFRNAKAWDGWALRSLLALGAGHVLAGIIFFFAYNWHDLSETIKFGLVFGGMIMSALAWIGLKLDKPIAQVFGISLTVLIGVFLAVFGQVFQTPAAIYTPFTLWAIMSLPFAVVSRSLAHWAVWLVIATIATNAYVGFGLKHLYGGDVYFWAYTVFVAAFFALLIVYDRIQNIWPVWARAGWFRLLLVTVGFVYANVALAIAVLDNNVNWAWLLVALLATGVLAYLYKLQAEKFTYAPPARLASLVIAASGLGVMATQIGLRAIAEITDKGDAIVFGFLLGFLWMAGITYILARTFKHFRIKSKHEQDAVTENQNVETAPDEDGQFNPSNRVSIEYFASSLQIDESATREVMLKTADDDVPWYMEMFLGFAGVFTAILAMVFLGSLLAVTLNVDSPESFLALGLVVWGGSVFARLNTDGLFPRHFFNTVLMGGGALAVLGAGMFFDGEVGFILFSMGLSSLTLWLVRDRILEFLMAAGFAGLLVYVLLHYNVPYAFIWLYTLCVGLGVTCLTYPMKTGFGQWRRTRILGAAGAAFLLAPCVFAVFLLDAKIASNLHLGMSSGWAERGASIIVTGAAILYLNLRRPAGTAFRPQYLITLLLLVAITLMPLGSAAALLLMLTGYILGLRSLTIIGVLAQIGFMSWYYYDMDITLLNKSLLLMGFGAVLLLVYGITVKQGSGNRMNSKQGGQHV